MASKSTNTSTQTDTDKPIILPGYILHDLGNGQLVLVPEFFIKHSAFQVEAEEAKVNKKVWQQHGKVSVFLVLRYTVTLPLLRLTNIICVGHTNYLPTHLLPHQTP